MPPSARSQTLLVAIGQALSALVSLLTVAYLARSMPASELGMYLYFVAVAAALEGLSDLGLRLTGVASLSSATLPSSRRATLDSLWRLKVLLSVCAIVIILLARESGLLQYADRRTALVLALVTVTLPSASPMVWDARALGLQWLESALLVVYRLLLLGAVVMLDPQAVDAVSVLVVLLATNVAFLVMLGVARERWTRPDRGGPPSPVSHLALLRSAAPLGLSLLLAQVAPRIWVLLLAALATSEDVAVFTVAVSVVQTVLLFGVAAGAAYLPVLSRKARDSRDEFRTLAAQLLEAMALVGAVVGVGMALSAAGLVPAVFGPAMRPAGTMLVVLSVLPPVTLVSFTCRIVLGAAGTGRADLLATLGGLCLGVLVAVALWAMLDTWAVVAGYVTSELATGAGKMAALARVGAVAGGCLRRNLLACAVPLLAAVAIGLWLARTGPGVALAVGAGIAGVITYAVMLRSHPTIRSRGLRGFLP